MATVMRVAARNALAIQSFKVISKALFFMVFYFLYNNFY